MSLSDQPVVLDTHAFFWLVSGTPDRFSVKSRRLIRTKAANHHLYIPAIVIWEIAMLESKSRIALNKSCNAWCDEALAQPGFRLVALSPEIAIDSTRLPGEFHADPADRMIVATARANNALLLTNDKNILAYSASGAVQSQAL